MNTMHEAAQSDMKGELCPICGSKEKITDGRTFETSCAECGEILAKDFLYTHTSSKGKSGELERTGQAVDKRNQSTQLNYDPEAPSALFGNNEERLKRKMKREINHIVSQLDDYPGIQDAVSTAVELYVLFYCTFFILAL